MSDPRPDLRADVPAPTRLVDIDVPFSRLVLFFFKSGLAIIPALFLIWAVVALIMFALGAMFGTGFMEHGRMMRW